MLFDVEKQNLKDKVKRLEEEIADLKQQKQASKDKRRKRTNKITNVPEIINQYANENEKMAKAIIELRNALEAAETELEHYKSDTPPVESIRSFIPDLRTRDQLKEYMRDGFKNDTINRFRKIIATYQINYSLTQQEMAKVTNEIEQEFKEVESAEFLNERAAWITAVKNPQEVEV